MKKHLPVKMTHFHTKSPNPSHSTGLQGIKPIKREFSENNWALGDWGVGVMGDAPIPPIGINLTERTPVE